MAHQVALKCLLLAFLLGLSSSFTHHIIHRSESVPKTPLPCPLHQLSTTPTPQVPRKRTAMVDATEHPSLHLELLLVIGGNGGMVCCITLAPKSKSERLYFVSSDFLDGKNLLIATYENVDSGDPDVTFSIINMKDCNLHRRHTIIITKPSGIEPIFIGEFYRPHKWDSFGDWLETNTRVEVVADNLLLIQFHDTTDTYKVRLYNSATNYKELLSIPDAADIDVVYANLTFCWVRQPGKNNVTTCSKFDEQGNLEFSKNISYLSGVHISMIKNNLDEVLLIARGSGDEHADSVGHGYMYFTILSKNREPTSFNASKLEFVNSLNNI